MLLFKTCHICGRVLEHGTKIVRVQTGIIWYTNRTQLNHDYTKDLYFCLDCIEGNPMKIYDAIKKK